MKKILIVEDDQDIANLERDYLEIHQFEVQIAYDGIEALKLIKDNPFDLVLLDIMLPLKNGYEVCKEIRKEQDIPILMITAKDTSSDMILGLGLGADDYITKPFEPMELVARVKAHLARYERLTKANIVIKEQAIEIDQLRILEKERRVYLQDMEIKMAKREFDILLFLAMHPNIVFSKEQIFEAVWGYDYMSDSATVTVHINRIREKIEKDSENPRYIETIWGAGYRFTM